MDSKLDMHWIFLVLEWINIAILELHNALNHRMCKLKDVRNFERKKKDLNKTGVKV